jgi:hypothetical protein
MRPAALWSMIVMTAAGLMVWGVAEPGTTSASQEPPRLQFMAAAGSPVAVGPLASKILVADMNGDGLADVVVTCGGLTAGKSDPKKGFVAILSGDGKGGLKSAGPLLPIGAEGLRAAVGDFNGDRRPDIAVIAHDSYEVALLLQDERGQFDAGKMRTIRASPGTRPHTHEVTVADVNGDSRLDILTGNAEDGNISVLLGDGAGRFEPAQGSPFAACQHPYTGLCLADLNGDGKLDVVVPDIHGHAVSVLLGDGTGRFVASTGSPIAVGPRPGSATIGDADGDGKLDIVATHDDDPIVYVLRGDGRGGFQPTAGSPIRLKERVWWPVLADLNRDGKNDLVLGAQKDHIVILLGEGAGGFGKDPMLVPVGGKAPGYLTVADMNRDGKLDVVTSNYDSGDVSVLLQR